MWFTTGVVRIVFLILTALFFLFAGVSSAFAVTITLSNIPSSISDQSFNFDVSVSGASAGTNYLRVDLYNDGTTNYFGETFVNGTWYNGSIGNQYFPIIILSGQVWIGSVQGRIGTPSITDFPGSGTYKLKIRRYTSSGTASSGDDQTPASIEIALASPTPTSSPTPTPTSSSSTFTFTDAPSKINFDQSFTVKITLSMPNSPDTEYYLKGAFKHTDSTRYLGLTKKGSDWIEYGDDYSDQYKITTDSSGNWTGDLEVKPDAYDNDYKGPGDYIFKVGKLTSTGYGPTWSNNETTIKIEGGNSPAPTPTSTPNPTPSKTPAPSSQLKSPTPSITPKSTPQNDSVADVATSQPSPQVEVKNQKQINPIIWVGLIFIFAGAATIGYIYWKKKHDKIH